MSVEFPKSSEKFKSIMEIKAKLPVMQCSVRVEEHVFMYDSDGWGICTFS